VNADVAPALGSRSFQISAEIEAEAPEGVIVSLGSRHSGLALYVKDGRLIFDYNAFGQHYRAVSGERVPRGRSQLGVAFTRIDRRATAEVVVDGARSGRVEIPLVLRMFSTAGMDIGRSPGSPVAEDYEAPFPFAGAIHQVVFETPKRVVQAHEAEAARTEQRVEFGRE
jgi:arylsulfatase